MKVTTFQIVALATQWLLLLWLNFRLDADPFIQLVMLPLLLLLSLATTLRNVRDIS